MAGIAKPNVPGLKPEASYIVLGGSGSQASSHTHLFDGKLGTSYANSAMYFETVGVHYVEIEIATSKVNIWRSGVNGYEVYNYPLKISKFNGASYVDVTSSFPQTLTQIGASQWEKTISNLPSGRYRFELGSGGYGSSVRIDGEWYIEVEEEIKHLIYHNGEYKKFNPAIPSGNIIPDMTSNTSPSGIASSSTPIYATTHDAWYAMNKKVYNTGDNYWYAGSQSAWLAYEFPNEVSISSYGFKGVDTVPNRTPKTWTFEKYDFTTSKWEIIHSSSLSSGDTVMHEYNLSTSHTGKKFRLNVSSTFGDNVAIDEFIIRSTGIEENWEVVSTSLPTQTQFQSSGMLDLSVYNRGDGSSALDALTGNFEIITWSENPTATKQLKINHTPYPQLIMANRDIDISNIQNLNNIKLNNTKVNSGIVKAIVSFDGGSTWKTYSAGNFVNINPTVADVSINGIDPTVLNSITFDKWAIVRGTSKRMRFAYYLEHPTQYDSITVDSLVTTADMNGKWKHYKDADYEYSSNTILSVTLYHNGDYKINY